MTFDVALRNLQASFAHFFISGCGGLADPAAQLKLQIIDALEAANSKLPFALIDQLLQNSSPVEYLPNNQPFPLQPHKQFVLARPIKQAKYIRQKEVLIHVKVLLLHEEVNI